MAALEPRRPRRPHPSFERGVAAEEKSNNLNLPVAEGRPRDAAWNLVPSRLFHQRGRMPPSLRGLDLVELGPPLALVPPLVRRVHQRLALLVRRVRIPTMNIYTVV